MKGKCLCGQIEFRLSGDLPNLYQCHCSLCKKASGSSSNSGMIVGLDKFEWVSGEDNVGSYTKENGFRADFCLTCGSPVPNKMNLGEYMWIPVGLIDGEIQSRVAAHIFTGHKAGWEDEGEHCQYLTDGPENIDEFIASLHSDV